MKLLMTILSLLTLTSCSPEEILQNDEIPASPSIEQPDSSKNNTMKITIGSTLFTAILATNATVDTFKTMLPLTLTMNDYNNNEKVSSLPNSLITAASTPGVIKTGDIMLYGSNSFVLFYETFSSSYNYTRIGYIDNITGLKEALGIGSITIKFELK